MDAADSGNSISSKITNILGRINFITGVLSWRDKVQFGSLKKLVEDIQHAFGKTKQSPEPLLVIWLDQVKIVLHNLDEDLSHHFGEKNACMPMPSFFSQALLLTPKTWAMVARLEGLAAIGTEFMVKPDGEKRLCEAYRKLERVWDHFRSSNSDSLTDQLKLCFAYCSLFPKDCEIDTQRLIYLWMAEEFLGESDLAMKYVHLLQLVEKDDLNVEDLLQMVEKDDFKMNSVRTWKMSPVMHDLATLVSGIKGIWNLPDQRVIRRVSLDFSLHVSRDTRDFDKRENTEELWTILLPVASQLRRRRHPQIKEEWSSSICDNLFSKFKMLRVLDLHDLGIKKLPSSIGEMEHLKFLDLSHNDVEKLPGFMTKLSNLQTLNLSHCHLLKSLPKNLHKLNSLRRLDIEACQNLTHMPPKMGRMNCLHILTHFVVSKHKRHGLFSDPDELRSFKNLRGGLEILHLQRLKIHGGNGVSCLKDMSNLERLSLRWDHDNDKKQKKDKDQANHNQQMEEDLERFEPHLNLKVLSIVGYKGEKFPPYWPWSSFSLVKFNLYNCSKCESLPPLDQFPSLKVLELRSLESLKSITQKPHTNWSSSFFTSLKQLVLSDCPNLESWRTEEATPKGSELKALKITFPCISKLQVQYCPKLICMPLYLVLDEELILGSSRVEPLLETINSESATDKTAEQYPPAQQSPPLSKLKSMQLANIVSDSPELEKMLVNLTSLKRLHIQECPNLQCLPMGFSKLSSLEELIIGNCKLLNLLENKELFDDLPELQSLSITELPMLAYLPTKILNVKSLKTIRIHSCPELERLLYRSTKKQEFHLQNLEISECPKLALLPRGMKNLQTLKILGCPRLTPRLKRDAGDLWERIEEVKKIIIR